MILKHQNLKYIDNVIRLYVTFKIFSGFTSEKGIIVSRINVKKLQIRRKH